MSYRELKRKQALLRSNLPGIDSSLYTVKYLGPVITGPLSLRVKPYA